ncbi:MAG: lipopolysaccharide biosynthesis protein [Gammaproteobacteria bacterium]
MSLRSNVAWTTLGYAIYTFCQWLILVVVARFLGVGAVGQLGFALAICAPIATLANLGLRVGQATDARRDFGFGTYWALRTAGGAFALTLTIVVALLLDRDANTSRIILLVGVAKMVESHCDVFYGLFQQRERMDWMARSLIVRGILGFAALSAGTALSGQLAIGLACQAVCWLLVFLAHDLRMARVLLMEGVSQGPSTGGIQLDWNTEKLWSLLRVSIPLGVSGGLISLRQSTPRYVIERLLGLEAVGLFTAVFYILTSVVLFINAIGHASSARLARLYAQGKKDAFKMLLSKLAAASGLVGFALFLLASAWGDNLIGFLYGPDFLAARGVLVALMAAAGIRFAAAMFQFGIFASRQFTVHLAIQATLLAAAILFCFTFVQMFGLTGAGWAVFAVALIHMAIVVKANLGLISRMQQNEHRGSETR